MQPRTLKIGISSYSYGGNGGLPSTHPAVMMYLMDLIPKLQRDKRISGIVHKDFCDTPITMTRNESVLWAREKQCDVLLMIDSDMHPDIHLGEPGTEPFWNSSFDFLYNHWDKGPVCIGAPYCGPPPIEKSYTFLWENSESDDPGDNLKLRGMSRDEAAIRGGIEAVAALPTGLILWDMRCFELTAPKPQDAIKRITKEWLERIGKRPFLTEVDICTMVQSIFNEKTQAENSWFYYEYTDEFQAQKASTEDVTVTRDISIAGMWRLGYNPVFCNWNAWAGHMKQKIVGKPRRLTVDTVAEKLRRSAREGIEADQRVVNLQCEGFETLKWPEKEQPKIIPAWKNPDGTESFLFRTDDASREALIELVQDEQIRLGRQVNVIEVGTWVGETAVALADIGARVFCIDSFDGDETSTLGQTVRSVGKNAIKEKFLANVGDRLNKSIALHEGASLDAAKLIGTVADVVFIDADHSYEACRADILVWSKHVRPGGVLCGHDYDDPGFPGVTTAVHEVLGEVESEGKLWWKRLPEKEECHVEQTEELGHAVSGVWGRDSAAETLPAMQECAAADG